MIIPTVPNSSSESETKKILLHVGYPKCASTYIQERVLPAVDGINIISKKTHPDFYDEAFKPEIDFDPDQVWKTLPNSNLPLVISFERFLRPPLITEPGGIGFIARRLKSLFPDAMINIVVRNQFDAIESFMLQWLLGGDIGGLGSVNRFEKMARNNSLDLEYYNYPKVIGFYQKLFGENHVNVYLLEDLVVAPDRFAQNFLAPIQKRVDRLIRAENRSRPRVSPFSYAFLRAINAPRYTLLKLRGIAYGAGVSRGIYAAVRSLDKLYEKFPVFGRRPSMLCRESREFIQRYYAESNRELENLLDRHLEGLGYPI